MIEVGRQQITSQENTHNLDYFDKWTLVVGVGSLSQNINTTNTYSFCRSI